MNSQGQIFIFSILKTFTKTYFLTFCLLLQGLQSLGQLNENFDDRNIDKDPGWSGNPDHFSASSGDLQLAAPAQNGTSYLTTGSAAALGTSWECDVRLDFNPSASNYCRFYLMSDNGDLTAPLNGYYIMVGGSGDDISLYKQTGTTRVKIIDGMDKRLDRETISLTIKATLSITGEWQVSSMIDGEENFITEGTAVDKDHATSFFCGIECVYTSTRSDKFHFDNLIISPFGEPAKPRLDDVTVISSNEVHLSFSGVLQQASMENPANYIADGQLGQPVIATATDHSTAVTLQFSTAFEAFKPYALSHRNLVASDGNVLPEETAPFTYTPHVSINFKDVVISEFMADPSPTVSLPASEFIELYNRGISPVSLAGWSISDGSTTGILSDAVLPPAGYVIIVPAEHAGLFTGTGLVMGITGFPSLNNSGDNIILKNDHEITIDSIRYADSWYKDSFRKEGGWTLEIIDPDDLCGAERNWSVSEDASGGTPGKVNSIDAEHPDLTGPELVVAYARTPDTVRLIFNERLRLPEKGAFTLSPSRNIISLELSATGTFIDLSIDPPLTDSDVLEIKMDGVYDCPGNALSEAFSNIEVLLPLPADSLDVVINEVLFNPRQNGHDFVEIANSSGKPIDLNGWSFATVHDGSIAKAETILAEGLILRPMGILAFSPDREVILSEYPANLEEKILSLRLPALNDDAGTIMLITDDGKIIDDFNYSEDMHSVFLKDAEGVSLERISATSPTQDQSNWRSCSTQFYATPGSVNSNAISNVDAPGEELVLTPEIFVPLTGQPDFTTIRYHLNIGGFIANIRILDHEGRIIKTICENALLGVTGFFRWDGDRDDGTKASIGNYMVRADFFDSAGTVMTIRRRVAVGGNF